MMAKSEKIQQPLNLLVWWWTAGSAQCLGSQFETTSWIGSRLGSSHISVVRKCLLIATSIVPARGLPLADMLGGEGAHCNSVCVRLVCLRPLQSYTLVPDRHGAYVSATYAYSIVLYIRSP